MTINKTVKNLAVLAGISAAVIGVSTGVNFYAHHNVNYETDDKIVFQKVDGIITYTSMEIDKENGKVSVTNENVFNYRNYEDNNGDGIVNSVFLNENKFERGSHLKSFIRDKHLKQHPVVFQNADKYFRQQMKRFKPYTKR